MKKRILTGLVLCAAISAFPQHSRLNVKPSGKVDASVVKDYLYRLTLDERSDYNPRLNIPVQPVSQQKGAPSTFNWNLLCGSMNPIGMTNSGSRPLQYNEGLNAVSFIHRKSVSYQPNPGIPNAAQSGVIVAEISSNWGTTWDSTCLYSNSTEWGRYPQGAIYNPGTNTNLNNAYMVGSGVTVGASSFSGSWYASKRLNVFNNVPPAGTGEQQFYSFNLTSYPTNMPKHGWSMNGFTATRDGAMRSLAMIGNDLQSSNNMRGFAVVTGTFNGTAFDWKIDTIVPPCMLKPDGNKYLNGDPQMAWNESGTVGYVVGIGALVNTTLATQSFQPIIYKYDKTQASPTWTLMNPINLNAATYSVVINHLPLQPVTYPVVTGDSTAIPFTDDFDIAVDARNDLHIGITFNSGASDHPDSLNFYATYKTSINPTESYKWGHVPGWRPYLYDFIGDGSSPWKLVVVDSMSSEGPGLLAGYGGYNENPWDPSSTGQKLAMDSRLHMGRTPDGNFISFSWAESDSNFTNQAFKFNNLPDIKVRSMNIGVGTNMYKLNTNGKINITGSDNDVLSRASLHFMSPTTGTATIIQVANSYSADINSPFTVTNSNPYAQTTSNTTWYGAAMLDFQFPGTFSKAVPVTPVAVNEINNTLNNCVIYPNPAHHAAELSITLKETTEVNISILNTVGQNVKQIKKVSQGGDNKITLDLDGMATGIYFINIKAGDSSATKKLVIE